MIRKGWRERDGLNAFSVPVERTKRISGSANAHVGKRGTTGAGGGRKKKGRGRLAGSPASLQDFHEEGPTWSCSPRLHSALSTETCTERENAGLAWVLQSLTSYYYTPYMAVRHTSQWWVARSRQESGLRIWRHHSLPGYVSVVFNWTRGFEDARILGIDIICILIAYLVDPRWLRALFNFSVQLNARGTNIYLIRFICALYFYLEYA